MWAVRGGRFDSDAVELGWKNVSFFFLGGKACGGGMVAIDYF